MTFTDEHPPTRDNPVALAQRSTEADIKATTKRYPAGNPLRSLRGLLDHLATLTRNQIRYHHTHTEIPMLTDPTPVTWRFRPHRHTHPPHRRVVRHPAPRKQQTPSSARNTQHLC